MGTNRRKRPNGEGSIFQLADGRWRAVISVGSVRGKRRRKTKTVSSQAAARRELKKLREDSAKHSRGRSVTLSAYLERWLEKTVLPNRATTTYKNYRSHVDNHIAPAIGGIRLDDLTPEDVEDFLDESDATSSVKEHAFVILRAALNHAAKRRTIDWNPCSAVEKPAHRPADVDPFDHAEAAKILKETRDDRLHAVYVLGLATGMRQGELFGLRRRDVDLEAGTVSVLQQARECEGKIEFVPPKYDSRRTIHIGPRTVEALGQQLAESMRAGHASSDLVFTNTRGNVIHRSNFGNRTWGPLLKRLDLRHRGAHQLRHTAASLMLSARVPVHVVARVLGHKKPSTTLDIYAHLIADEAEACAATVDGLLSESA